MNARRTHPAVDRGYALLSRAADRSVLWFLLAAVLVVIGRGRAALRGSSSLLAASILANLVGKRVFGGDRPLLKDIPVGRHVAKPPTSPSFPSGHAASAAAFAAGVALESPRAGKIVAPVAAAVAYSRLHTGAHWLSDVLGGGILGVAVGFAGKLLVPGAPAPEVPAREGGTEIELPAMPDGDPITVLNAASIGLYPGFVAEREKHEKSLGKWLSGVIAAVAVLRASEPVDVDVNGRTERVWSLFVGVNRNHPATIAPVQRRRLDDGVLDVRILTAGSRVRAVGSLVFGRRTSAVARRILRLDSALEGFTAESVTVVVRPRPGQPPGFAHDGEVELGRSAPAGGSASTPHLVPGALEVYSPWAVSRSS